MIKGLRLILLILPSLWGFSMTYGQSGEISGKVADTSGNPLIGATVIVDGTTMGSATNLDGLYSISGVPAGEFTLKISLLKNYKFC